MSTRSMEQLLASPKLPSLPAVAVKVLELTRDKNVNLSELANTVQNDPALSGKILKTVNSSFYGLTKPCPTITRALAYLGLSTVKSLVLGFSLVDWAKGDRAAEDLLEYWRRNVLSAAAARRLAVAIRGIDPEEVFIAALMQDIGVLVLQASAPGDYLKVIERAGTDHAKVPAACRDIFGFDHTDIGVSLADKWRLPPLLGQAIKDHHAVDATLARKDTLVRIVALSSRIAMAIARPESNSELHHHAESARVLLSISIEAFHEVVRGAIDDAGQLARLLTVQIGRMPDVETIMLEAEEQRVQTQLEAQRESETLRQNNDALARATITDALTGAVNRKGFDQEMDRLMTCGRTDGATFALIMCDADKFKSLNDTHGHQAGDAVLKDIAARLLAVIRNRGMVCRYGGEEFAVILPNVSRPQAAQYAEALRRAIEAKPFDLTGTGASAGAIPVTISLGVSAFEPALGSRIDSPTILIQAADKALYAAKHAGRNCVRVFAFRAAAQTAAA